MSVNFHLFVRSVFFRYSSKILILLCSFLYTYFITNYFGPEKYGIVNYIFNFMTLIILLFGVQAASQTINIFTARTKSKEIFTTMVKIELGIVLLLFGSILVISRFFPSFFGGYTELWQLGSITILLTPFYFNFIDLFESFKNFGKVLKLSVLEAATNLMLTYCLVFYLNFDISGVIIGKILSVILFIVVASFYSRKLPFLSNKPDLGEAKKYFKGMLSFNFLKKAYEQLVIIILGLFVSLGGIGTYYLYQKICMNLIGVPLATFSEVLVPFSSEKYNSKKKMLDYASQVIRISIILSLFIVILLLLFGGYFIRLLFPKFQNDLVILTLYSILAATSAFIPITDFFRITNKTQILSKVYVIILAFVIIFGSALTYLYSLAGLLITQIIVSGILYIYLLLAIRKEGYHLKLIPQIKDLILMKNAIFLLVNKK